MQPAVCLTAITAISAVQTTVEWGYLCQDLVVDSLLPHLDAHGTGSRLRPDVRKCSFVRRLYYIFLR